MASTARPEVTRAPGGRAHGALLEIDRVSKRYGDVVALTEMSFDVAGGELFGFVGSNGAGKTTTMRIALGVLAADSGQVRWQGAPVTFETRRRIGYLPEERGLYPKMRVAEQLAYLAELHGMPSKAARVAAGGWIERFGLGERARDEVQKPGQPAAGAAGGGAGARARGASSGSATGSASSPAAGWWPAAPSRSCRPAA